MEPVTPRRGLLGNRAVRLLSALVLFVVICVILVFGAISVLRSSRNGPINVDVYPGAATVKVVKNYSNSSILYSTTDSVQQVLNFYNGRLPKDESIEGCKKIYTDDKPSEEPGHFYARCIVDNSQLDVSQLMMITINYQAVDGTNKKETRILIEQQWGAS